MRGKEVRERLVLERSSVFCFLVFEDSGLKGCELTTSYLTKTLREERRKDGRTEGTGNATTLMLEGRATTPLHDTPLQFPNWEGVNEQLCSCMRKTLLCRTAQLNDARTPSFQVPRSHPLPLKPRLFHTNVASTLPRPAKTATTLCQGRPTYLPRTYPPASHTTRSSRNTYHARAVTEQGLTANISKYIFDAESVPFFDF